MPCNEIASQRRRAGLDGALCEASRTPEYRRAAEITGLDESTLRTFVSIAGRFELLSRNNKLTYNHHKEAASLKRISTDKKGKLYQNEPKKVK